MIIKEVRPPQPPVPPPLYIRKSAFILSITIICYYVGQRPPPPPTLPPLVIREAPPNLPPTVGTQGTTIYIDEFHV